MITAIRLVRLGSNILKFYKRAKAGQKDCHVIYYAQCAPTKQRQLLRPCIAILEQ